MTRNTKFDYLITDIEKTIATDYVFFLTIQHFIIELFDYIFGNKLSSKYKGNTFNKIFFVKRSFL